MPRVLLVAQETGGVGKSTVTRGLAEAVPDAPILEIESVHRLTEFREATAANEPGSVRYFEMRATREAIEASGGKAARAELDDVINALHEVAAPTLIDIGANTSASLLADSDGSRPPIPTRSRPAFRFDVGHHSEMKPATR